MGQGEEPSSEKRQLLEAEITQRIDLIDASATAEQLKSAPFG